MSKGINKIFKVGPAGKILSDRDPTGGNGRFSPSGKKSESNDGRNLKYDIDDDGYYMVHICDSDEEDYVSVAIDGDEELTIEEDEEVSIEDEDEENEGDEEVSIEEGVDAQDTEVFLEDDRTKFDDLSDDLS